VRFTGLMVSLRRSTSWKTGTLIDKQSDQGASRFIANGQLTLTAGQAAGAI
jgi:hypothetical protein